MSTPITSDTNIINVNNSLNTILLSYVTKGVIITFDLPDLDNLPSEPTLSVFLYEIHEDLRLRTGQSRTSSVPDKTTNAVTISPGWVNVNCNYLITYWDSTQGGGGGDSPASAPDNQAIKVMNQVVNALVNNRTLPGLTGSYTRMIAPKDELNSLGNFWQSLGNKPRLSLYASVTVPITLSAAVPVTAVGVLTTEADLEQGVTQKIKAS
ncbi:Pvc16 family protein [Paraburkholderia xenovorans]|uniref:Pvc16 family protein n=1 Tax=Paraburkholderia xenovorans TaxID=36873 RepID=UPI0038B8674F